MSLFDSLRRWRNSRAETSATTPGDDAATASELAAERAPAFPDNREQLPLPAVADAAPPGTESTEAAQTPAPAHDGPERRTHPRLNAPAGTRVLVVDDSATIVALLRRMLQQNQYEVLEAYDAETAIELARRERPELMFLDIVLPNMDGFSALRLLRRDPLTRDIPIIMISGNVQATEQFYVQRIGADDFMKKPFTRGEVFARIERLLGEDLRPRRMAQRSATTGAADAA